jgi:transposase-like protein
MPNGKGSLKWDVERAAEELGVSPHTLRAWLRAYPSRLVKRYPVGEHSLL